MQSQTHTLASLAGEAYDQFGTRTRYEMPPNALRSDAETFAALKDDAPDWVQDLVRRAHGDLLPDDWRYETIRTALSYISDTDAETVYDLQDTGSEFADGNVDAYTSSLLAWLGSHSSRVGYCDDARQSFGSDQDAGIVSDIMRGQYMESEEVFASVVNSLAAHLDSLDS